MSVPDNLSERLKQHGQGHLVHFWDRLNTEQRERLTAELSAVDLDRLNSLIRELVHEEPPNQLNSKRVKPVSTKRLPRTDGERVARRLAAERGEELLAKGEVAIVLVAGGQGTRLGFDGPKGTYPIGPVSAASLFQIHAEKIRALTRRYGKTLPLYVMTSPENHESTTQFFEQHDNFGLEHLRLFVQGQMPAVDRETGRILLAEPGHLALSPDGHGGTLDALDAPTAEGKPSCLAEMRERGIQTIFYFQVDNPIVQIADPAFLGLHRDANADVSFKVVEKIEPDERVGVVVELDGRPTVIEYSDLPAELGEMREPDGSLTLAAGSIAIHLFEREFIERIVGRAELPFHRAFKKVKFVDEAGRLVEPETPNAVKFERFIFDTLPLADRYTVVETERRLEFEPLKNATGPDSPASVRQRMSDLYAGWLESAGAKVVRRSDGTVPFAIEISPLFALDSAELREKIRTGFVVEEALYLK